MALMPASEPLICSGPSGVSSQVWKMVSDMLQVLTRKRYRFYLVGRNKKCSLFRGCILEGKFLKILVLHDQLFGAYRAAIYLQVVEVNAGRQVRGNYKGSALFFQLNFFHQAANGV